VKSIKLIQFGSAIAVLTIVAFLIVVGAIIMFADTQATMDQLVKWAGIVAIFVGPEVLAAFFGNYLKRKQNGQTSVDQENNR